MKEYLPLTQKPMLETELCQLRLRKVFRENHGSPIVQIVFPPPGVHHANIFATVGSNQVCSRL